MNGDRTSPPRLLAPETETMELSSDVVSELLEPDAWKVALDRFARTMKLAVALTDATGRVLGECHNPQAIWSLARAKRPPNDGECPFCLMPLVPCTSINDAVRSGEPVLSRDQ